MKKVLILLTLFSSTNLQAQIEENEIIKTANLRQKMEYEVLAYPNPSRGNVHISAPSGSLCKIDSSNGTYIGTWEVNHAGLDVEGLPMGSYIITISFNQELTLKRLIVL